VIAKSADAAAKKGVARWMSKCFGAAGQKSSTLAPVRITQRTGVGGTG
jgi:hypothetical protein